MNRLLLVVCLLCVMCASSASGAVQKWTFCDEWLGTSGGGQYRLAWFELDGNALTVHGVLKGYSKNPQTGNVTWTYEPWDPGAPYNGYVGIFSGWAFCGTQESYGGERTPDPYATFVETSRGNGYISWSPLTPAGYVAKLRIGDCVISDWIYPPWGGSIAFPVSDPTIYVCDHYSGGYVFDATYSSVPEPSSLVATAVALTALVRLFRRRKR